MDMSFLHNDVFNMASSIAGLVFLVMALFNFFSADPKKFKALVLFILGIGLSLFYAEIADFIIMQVGSIDSSIGNQISLESLDLDLIDGAR